jgi:hypothetical protein
MQKTKKRLADTFWPFTVLGRGSEAKAHRKAVAGICKKEVRGSPWKWEETSPKRSPQPWRMHHT